MLKAGTAIIDVSPPAGIELAGYPHFPRYNTGINDPLYASSLYLDNGKERILLIAIDLLFFSRKYVRQVRKRIQKNTTIPEENIFISVSHTHSGPWAAGRLDMEALEEGLGVDEKYVGGLNDRIVEIASEAYGNTFNAGLGSGYVICGREKGIGGNRRDPRGKADPRLWTIAVKETGGDIRAVIVKYALHPTVIHEDSTVVTADYPGYLRQFLKRHHTAVNLLFMQGTSGDQSTRYFRQGQDFREARRIGDTLGECAIESMGQLVFEREIELGSISEKIELPLKELPDEGKAEAFAAKTRSEWERLKEKGASYIEIQNANLKNLGAENTLGYARLKKRGIQISLESDELPGEIQVLTIGDTRIVGLPGEVFVRFGLDIQERSPYEKTIVVELANGCLPGYVCTKDAIAQGGYEVGASMLSGQAGEVLVDNAVRLLEKS